MTGMTKKQKIAVGAVLVVSAGALIYSLATYKGQPVEETITDAQPRQGQTLGEIIAMEQSGAGQAFAPIDPTPVTFGPQPGAGQAGMPPVATSTSTVPGPSALAPTQALGQTPGVTGQGAASFTQQPVESTQAVSGTPVATTPATSAAPVAATASYKIKPGDTLQGIAQRELGSANKWKDILAANPGINPNRLKIGMSLAMPANTGTVASGPVASSTTAARGTASTGATPQSTAAKGTITTRDGVKIYTVRERDTLRKISKDVYGNDAMWQNVFKANRDVIGSDPGRLEPGTILIIPASGR
jgi:nucleoid-associated protein YgaU